MIFPTKRTGFDLLKDQQFPAVTPNGAGQVPYEVAAEEDAPSKPKTAAELRAAKKAKKKAKKEKKGKALRETMAAREDDDD